MNSDKTWIVQCDRPVKVDFSGNWMDVPFEKANTAFHIPDIRLLLMVLL